MRVDRLHTGQGTGSSASAVLPVQRRVPAGEWPPPAGDPTVSLTWHTMWWPSSPAGLRSRVRGHLAGSPMGARSQRTWGHLPVCLYLASCQGIRKVVLPPWLRKLFWGTRYQLIAGRISVFPEAQGQIQGHLRGAGAPMQECVRGAGGLRSPIPAQARPHGRGGGHKRDQGAS